MKHLSASQQKEYHRLKQQILEREKLKLQKKVASNNNNSGKNMSLNTKVTAKTNDMTKNTSNTCTSPNKNILTKTVKQTSSTQLKDRENLKQISNMNIKNTDEMSLIHIKVGSGTTVDPIDSVVENGSVKENRQPKSVLRALSKDEINNKYMQIQLRQDVPKVVKIAEQTSQHNSTNANSCEKIVENTALKDIKETEADRICDDSIIFDTSTLLMSSDKDKGESVDSMESTILLSQYNTEHQEVNPTPINSNVENNNNNNNNHKSDINAVVNKNAVDDVCNSKKYFNSFKNLPYSEQQQHLPNIEHKLVSKR